jgi:hypothetical protein
MTKRYSYFVVFIFLIFVLLYSVLSYYSRLATDDFAFIANLRTQTVIQSSYEHYMSWSGRFMANLFIFTLYQVCQFNQTCYFLFLLFSLLFLICGIYYAISNVFKQFNILMSSLHTWLLTCSFTILLFFMTIDIGETWFWYNALAIYLYDILFFIWGTAFLFASKSSIKTNLLAILCFIYVGGASELYSIIFSLFFILLFYYKLKKVDYHLYTFWNNPMNRRLTYTFFAFLLSFILVIIAPGNYERANAFPDPGLISSIKLIGWMASKFFFWFLPQRIVFILACGIPVLFIGQQYAKVESVSLKMLSHKMRVATLFLLASIFVVFFCIAFIMSQSGEYRVWFILSFLTTIYISLLFFYLGYYFLINNKWATYLKYISVAIGIPLMLYTAIHQYHLSKNYASAVDKRIEYLVELNDRIKKDTIIYLAPLPPCGMLYSGEISTDQNHFTNTELQLGYNLHFMVAKEK